MSEYVIMPKEDYVAICDAVRDMTGGTSVLKSGDIAELILGIGGNAMQEVSTAAEMDALLVSENVGNYYKYIGESTDNYINGDIYMVEEVV